MLNIRFVIRLGAILALGPSLALADYRGDIAYTRLQQELGVSMPTGAGVIVSQVEGTQQVNGQDAWFPDITDPEFAGKTIVNGSNAPGGLYSYHATGVAGDFYGLTRSIAPGISNITGYSANDWLGSRYLQTVANSTTGATPSVSTSRIANHSWIGGAPGFDTYVLRRLDWVIDRDEYIQLVGLNNGDGLTPTTNPLLSSAYNVIAVGRSDSFHAPGTVALDPVYTAGRARPDIVDPINATSNATPHVAATAALLIQTGHNNAALSSDPVAVSTTNRAGATIRNAERSEVIKAVLMAGADRVTHNTTVPNLISYRGAPTYQTANGLDVRYGAGQQNVRNSYLILVAGEQGSVEDGNLAATVGSRGFDYDPAFGGSSSSNITGTYRLPVQPTPQLLTASLVWNIYITGPSGPGFATAATLRNLDLTVIDLAAGGTPVVLPGGTPAVATSQSLVDNTENIWLVVPANAQYALRVTRVGTFTRDYGLAWQLVPDTDGDGVADTMDNCTLAPNGPLALDAGGNSQLDADGDGYGNLCDGDLNNNGTVNAQDTSIFRSKLGTSDPVADLNGNGYVNAQDSGIFKNMLGLPPGPSGLVP